MLKLTDSIDVLYNLAVRKIWRIKKATKKFISLSEKVSCILFTKKMIGFANYAAGSRDSSSIASSLNKLLPTCGNQKWLYKDEVVNAFKYKLLLDGHIQ